MAIRKKLKKSFTLIEVLVSLLLLGFMIFSSFRMYQYSVNNTKHNELRYIVLNKINNEMTRLVFAYENFSTSEFAEENGNTFGNWNSYLILTDFDPLINRYKTNPLKDSFGLHINENNNLIELKNMTGNIDDTDTVNVNDIVGLLGWKVEENITSRTANISLSLTYPYIAKARGTTDITINSSNIKVETINIKTSTKIN